MQTFKVKPKLNFVGRTREIQDLTFIGNLNKASIIIMYGRRRIGKTELLEQVFKDRNILKFEGIEGATQEEQLISVKEKLAEYTGNPLLLDINIKKWMDFFNILKPYVESGKWTIYFEELQWLAGYKNRMIAELKYAWDNFFRYNDELVIILCGSAPSFMIDNVVHSKSLYNRSQSEFRLTELNLIEAKGILKERSAKEIFDAYLTLGGMPLYLDWVNEQSSVYLGICKNAFTSNGRLLKEYDNIFTSSMSENPYYKRIIELLSQKKYLTRNEIAEELQVDPNGDLTKLLVDLEKVEFIGKYHPYDAGDKSINVRYCIRDSYLNFYYKYIEPNLESIRDGVYNEDPYSALDLPSYEKWLGFSFERWCKRYSRVIANILKISGIKYKAGVFFNRATNKESPGFQIDLLFDRPDGVITICEIKYLKEKVGTSVIDEMMKKCRLFPNKKNKTIHRVLICMNGATPSVINDGYFSRIITGEDLMDEANWR